MVLPARIRTCGLPITGRLLYLLSYDSKCFRERRRAGRDPRIVSSLERMPKRRLAERLRTAGHQVAFPFKRRPFPTGARRSLETASTRADILISVGCPMAEWL